MLDRPNSMLDSMRKVMHDIAYADAYFRENEDFIIDQMTLIWAAIDKKPVSMRAWAAEVWALHKASLE